MAANAASSSSASATSQVIGTHFRVGKKIGEGSFGVIFEGINLINNIQVAIKFEPRKAEAPQLRDEYRTYKMLVGCPGIPQVYYYGQEGLHNILVIDLLGPSLEDLFDHCGRHFSIKSTVMIAKQMVSRVQTIHDKNHIYRDIKPDNFLIGRANTKLANVVHVVDFGMAKVYRDPKTKQHIPYRERKALSGTARYMSINTHMGREQSRRDDLEALGHVFIYFLRGGLPWQGMRAANNKAKYEKIGNRKQEIPIDDLCEGLPPQFARFLKYCRNLGFEETPDYDYLREILTDSLKESGAVEDGEYDWMRINGGKGWEHAKAYPVQQTPYPPQGRMTPQKPSGATPVTDERLNKNLPDKPGNTWPRETPSRANMLQGNVRNSEMRRTDPGGKPTPKYEPHTERNNRRSHQMAIPETSGPRRMETPPAPITATRTPPQPTPSPRRESGFKRFLKSLCCC